MPICFKEVFDWKLYKTVYRTERTHLSISMEERRKHMTLYEINQNIESALERMFTEVDEETGEVKDELVTELAELNIARDEKLEAIGCYIKNLQAEAAAILEESKQLKARFEQKAKREQLGDAIRENILRNLSQRNGINVVGKDKPLDFPNDH